MRPLLRKLSAEGGFLNQRDRRELSGGIRGFISPHKRLVSVANSVSFYVGVIHRKNLLSYSYRVKGIGE
jgi:hypothetical protein